MPPAGEAAARDENANGFIFVSDQQRHGTFRAYCRQTPNVFVGAVQIAGTDGSDGSDVTAQSLGTSLESGAFVAMSDLGHVFSVFSWDDIEACLPPVETCGTYVAPPPEGSVRITEVFAGSHYDSGVKVTEDWFEITNIGSADVDTLGWYYDDESADPTKASPICGTPTTPDDPCPAMTIQPGGSIVVVVDGEGGVEEFRSVWDPLSLRPSMSRLSRGMTVGFADGAGLSGNGDAIFIFNSAQPLTTSGVVTIASLAYPDPNEYGANGHAETWTVHGYSAVSADRDAACGHLSAWVIPATTISSTIDHVGSPGVFCPRVVPKDALLITEVFAGAGAVDITCDWFEVTNTHTEALRTFGLFFDDESMDATVQAPLSSVTLEPGQVMIT